MRTIFNRLPAISTGMTHRSELEAILPLTTRAMLNGQGTLHLGMQLYVSLNGNVIVDGTIGTLDGHEPLTSDHRVLWLSAGKPLIAVAILQRVESGRIALDEPVAESIPEFGTQGKAQVTLRHLLTHTAGIQPVPTGWPRESWAGILDRICRAKLRFGAVAGEAAGYDPVRSWFLLGEWLQRLENASFETVMQSSVCRPLGLQTAGWSIPSTSSQSPVPMYACDGTTCTAQPDYARPGAAPSPGSSFRAPARELGRFYESLLPNAPNAVLSGEMINAMTSRQREGMYDITFQHTVDFGFGVLIDSNRYGADTVPYGFGRHCSPQTFGHGGSECSIGFADPQRRLVVAMAANGRPGEPAHQTRNREICSAIYEDLQLT